MAARGYAAASDVALALGVDALSTLQANQVAAWLEGAENWIDDYCGRAWLTGALTDERYDLTGSRLYLKQRPTVSVESVKGRWNWDTTSETLVGSTQYDVDLTRGLILFPPGLWPIYDYVLVSYTPAATVPVGITLATAQLLADTMTDPAQGGRTVKAFAVFGQVSMTFRDTAVSSLVVEWLAPFRTPVLA